MRFTKAKPDKDGEMPAMDIAFAAFGNQSHIAANRRYRLIRRWTVGDAAARLAELLNPKNTAADVRADTAYRSKKNEALLRQRLLVSHIHRKRPRGVPMPP